MGNAYKTLLEKDLKSKKISKAFATIHIASNSGMKLISELVRSKGKKYINKLFFSI